MDLTRSEAKSLYRVAGCKCTTLFTSQPDAHRRPRLDHPCASWLFRPSAKKVSSNPFFNSRDGLTDYSSLQKVSTNPYFIFY